MKTIVVGCGRAGAELAYRLFQKGHRVTIIDMVANSFNNLPSSFRGHTIEGDALNQDILRGAGVKDAEALAAMTNVDTLNIVVAHTALTIYHIPRVVARNYDPHTRPVFEAFGIQFFSSVTWAAQRFEEVLSDDIRPIFSVGNGEVAVYEIVAPLAWQGKRIQEIHDEGLLFVAITRSGRAILPSADQTIEANDLIHISTTHNKIAAISQQRKEG